MGATGDNIRAISDDIKSSWYFRFYALLWFVGFIVVIIALGILGDKARIEMKENPGRLWIENASALNFPAFHFSIPETAINDGVQFTSRNCMWNGSPVRTDFCTEPGTDLTNINLCFRVSAENIQAQNAWGAGFDINSIQCMITTNGTAAVNQMLHFSADDGTETAAAQGTHISPGNMTWIFLHLNTFGDDKHFYQKRVIQHSSLVFDGVYNVQVMFGSFFVSHYDKKEAYTGFRALGDVGGLAFFYTILMTFILLILGFFIPNHSTFLSKHE
eukprot:TRINITY_DN75_c0_g1_i1.p1 TRINITY_DN75_c0_g1~~TRINITY_DN75_c0_g1_i1.p1  ORF type:complete len:273 (+),score=78.76 TRINITY_DN75_c0_g1_i1:112-930(+)